MKILVKLICVLLCFLFTTNLSFAREKYSDEMERYMGIWRRRDKQGNILQFHFFKSDGWVVVKSKNLIVEGPVIVADYDCTYSDGKFNCIDKDGIEINSITFELKEGSLVYTNHVTYTDGSKGWSVVQVYDRDF